MPLQTLIPSTFGATAPISRVESVSISRVLCPDGVVAIWLGRPLPDASSALPGSTAGHRIAPLCGLAPNGVWPAGVSPRRWWALTPPFHPYLYAPAAATGPLRRPASTSTPMSGQKQKQRYSSRTRSGTGAGPEAGVGARRRCSFCATFRRIAPPGCYPALCPVELGLSSSGPRVRPRPPDTLSVDIIPHCGR